MSTSLRLSSKEFPHLLELCLQHLLVGHDTESAALATQVLELAPNESAFQSVLEAAKHTSLGNLDELRHRAATCEQHLDFQEAARAYILLIAHNRSDLETYEGLLNCYNRLNRRTLAIQTIEQCIPRVRENRVWLQKLAAALVALEQPTAAKNLYRAALELTPPAEQEPILSALGDIERKLKNLSESEAWFRRALEMNPQSYATQRELINLHLNQGNSITAHKLASEFFELNPKSLSLFFLKTSLELQPGYESLEQLEESRRRFAQGLHIIRNALETIPERIVPDFEFLLDNLNPFYLAYQGKSVIELQKAFAEICESAMNRLVPLPPLAARPSVHGRKIKVGVVSGFFRDHSNYKIPIRGWFSNLDSNTFETYAYHVSARVDACTDEASRYFHRFIQGPLPLRQWIDTIREDCLDVLIYPEIGMDPVCRKLACFRLAPVQVNSWGHPVTSGLSTIDYFLSSALMEGADSDSEYTEKLVRLPQLSINYEPPRRKLSTITRAQAKLRDDAIVYWCCQVVYKYLPQFDWVYAEIGRQVPNSQFVFITIQPDSEMSVRFKRRMIQAFTERGLNPEKHLVFLAGLSGDEFATVASLCDMSLDAFEWSGCNSTLETLAQGVPVITCPGRFMRGQHTAAILRAIHCEELITATPTQLIERAVELSTSQAKLETLSAKVREQITLAYHDSSCVHELARLLRSWVGAQT